MSDLTHCGHGVSMKEHCAQCETVWGHGFMTPEQVTLAKFYGVDTKDQLIDAQAKHVEKLQAKVPPMRDEQPRNPRKA